MFKVFYESKRTRLNSEQNKQAHIFFRKSLLSVFTSCSELIFQICLSTNRKMCGMLFIKLSEDLNSMNNSTLQYFGRVKLVISLYSLSDMQIHQLVGNISKIQKVYWKYFSVVV